MSSVVYWFIGINGLYHGERQVTSLGKKPIQKRMLGMSCAAYYTLSFFIRLNHPGLDVFYSKKVGDNGRAICVRVSAEK
jgi:hypothetical protein